MAYHQPDEEDSDHGAAATNASSLEEVQEGINKVYRELEIRVAGIERSNNSDQPPPANEIIQSIRQNLALLWRMMKTPDPPQLDYGCELERLYGLWRRVVNDPDDIIDYCEDRMQWLESRLAALGRDDGPLSARNLLGPDIESEIVMLKGEVRKQERILERRHRGAGAHVTAQPSTAVNGCEQKLIWRGTQTDVARFFHGFIQEGIIEEHGVAEFVARHILLRDEEGSVHEIDRKNFVAALRQFRTPSGTAKGSKKINEALERVGKRRKE
jgi:hypothetical protein